MSVYRTIVSLVLEGSRDHAFICMDPLGTVTDWLGAAEDIFGHTAQEAVGQSLALIFTPEDRHRGFDHYELQVAGTDGRSEDDRWHVRKDGTRVWASGTVNAMRDDAGRLIGFVKIVRDQTALRTQIELLENQVASLREGRERTHLFLKTLGHEMRNPLGSMDTAMGPE